MLRKEKIFITGIVVVLAGFLLGTTPAFSQNQRVRPPELNIQFHRAETAWKTGTSALEAKTRLDRVLNVLPDDTPALKLRAQILMSMSRPEEALRDARRAVQLNPEDGEAHLLLSEAALLNEKRALARQAMNEASEHVLENASLHIRLSWIALQLGEIEKAESFARVALVLDNKFSTCYYQLARIFALQGRKDDAAEILSRGLRAAFIDSVTILRDSTLSDLVSHPVLKEYFK